jgi:hypothetical protein
VKGVDAALDACKLKMRGGEVGGGSDPRRQGEEGEGGPNGVGVTRGRGGGLGSQQRRGPDGRGGRSGGIGEGARWKGGPACGSATGPVAGASPR